MCGSIGQGVARPQQTGCRRQNFIISATECSVVAPLSPVVQNDNSDYHDVDHGRPDFSGIRVRIAILLCTFNGERFLAQQLESIARQTCPDWFVVVSDDGSTDSTLELLREYSERWGDGKLSVRQGPRSGYAANFLSLTCDKTIEADYYAWADQDDIWQANKLECALQKTSGNAFAKSGAVLWQN
nr:glycosyltransferase [Pseudomonas sp. MD195_PC81_125]